jgi:hypothetical protein
MLWKDTITPFAIVFSVASAENISKIDKKPM